MTRQVLITTDIWDRGIDVPQVSFVINYDFPVRTHSPLLSLPVVDPSTDNMKFTSIVLGGLVSFVTKVPLSMCVSESDRTVTCVLIMTWPFHTSL